MPGAMSLIWGLFDEDIFRPYYLPVFDIAVSHYFPYFQQLSFIPMPLGKGIVRFELIYGVFMVQLGF